MAAVLQAHQCLVYGSILVPTDSFQFHRCVWMHGIEWLSGDVFFFIFRFDVRSPFDWFVAAFVGSHRCLVCCWSRIARLLRSRSKEQKIQCNNITRCIANTISCTKRAHRSLAIKTFARKCLSLRCTHAQTRVQEMMSSILVLIFYPSQSSHTKPLKRESSST